MFPIIVINIEFRQYYKHLLNKTLFLDFYDTKVEVVKLFWFMNLFLYLSLVRHGFAATNLVITYNNNFLPA